MIRNFSVLALLLTATPAAAQDASETLLEPPPGTPAWVNNPADAFAWLRWQGDLLKSGGAAGPFIGSDFQHSAAVAKANTTYLRLREQGLSHDKAFLAARPAEDAPQRRDQAQIDAREAALAAEHAMVANVPLGLAVLLLCAAVYLAGAVIYRLR